MGRRNMTKQEVLDLLADHGWEILDKGGKGSHTKVRKDGVTMSIPGHKPSSVLKVGILNKILKAAGLE